MDLDTFDSGAPGLTEEQKIELDYRLARYEQNPAGVIAWEQVRAGLSALIAGGAAFVPRSHDVGEEKRPQ